MDELFIIFMTHLKNPTVFSAVVTGMFQLLTGICAAVAAALIGKRFWDQERLKQRLDDALGDIEFLLEVEKEYDSHAKADRDLPRKQAVRQMVTLRGYDWTGRYTPGRAYRLRTILKLKPA